MEKCKFGLDNAEILVYTFSCNAGYVNGNFRNLDGEKNTRGVCRSLLLYSEVPNGYT